VEALVKHKSPVLCSTNRSLDDDRSGIIGSGIFGVPSELTRLLGRASPMTMISAG